MKSKPLVILITTFVVVAGIALFLIKPVASSILTSWKNLSQAKENLALIEEKKQIIESLKSNQNLTKVADIAEKYIPQDQESGQLVIELTAMASANNLQVEQTSIEKSKETSETKDQTETTAKASPTPSPKTSSSPATAPAATVNFTIKLNGAFNDFMNFLKATETSSRLILLKNISMQNKTEKDKPNSFSVQLSGSAYYKDEVSLEQNLENIKLSTETINKFLNLKTYGQPINLPSESGFGRQNPFENY